MLVIPALSSWRQFMILLHYITQASMSLEKGQQRKRSAQAMTHRGTRKGFRGNGVWE